MKIIWKAYDGKYENNIKQMWKSCKYAISHYFHIYFIFISHVFHILGPGARAPKYETHLKYIWNKYANNVILHICTIFTCISYYFHIIFIFLRRIFVILFSYVCEKLVFLPVHIPELLQVAHIVLWHVKTTREITSREQYFEWNTILCS